jgi:streptogramin lyase
MSSSSPLVRPRRAAGLLALVLIASVAFIGASPSPSSGATPTITTLPTATQDTLNPVVGPDGNLWWAGTGRLVSLNPDGTTTDHAAPSDISHGALVMGTNGRLWYLLFRDQRIGYIVPELDTYVDWPVSISSPSSLVQGPDGNMWFTSLVHDTLVRVKADGTQTELASPATRVFGLVAGADGALWYASQGSPGQVGRIDPATGTLLAAYPVPSGAGAAGIVLGPDGNYWFGEALTNRIGRATPAGVITEFTIGGDATGLAAGPDGNVWFSEPTNLAIGRITPAGVLTELSTQSVGPPNRIVVGPLGNLYFDHAPISETLGVVNLAGQLPTTTTTSTTTAPVLQVGVTPQPGTPGAAVPVRALPSFTG